MFDAILGIINKIIPDQNKKYDALVEMAKSDSETTRADAAILVKEMDSGVSLWRPRVAYLLTAYFLVFSVIYFIVPPLAEIFEWDICTLGTCNLEPSKDAMFSLVVTSVILLSLIIGREIVKFMRALKGRVL